MDEEIRLQIQKIIQSENWHERLSELSLLDNNIRYIEKSRTSIDCFRYIFSEHKVKRVHTLKELEKIAVNTSVEDNDVIFYFNGDTIAHVGKVIDNNTIESKWGRTGVFQHPIFSVSLSYGLTALFCKKSEYESFFKI